MNNNNERNTRPADPSARRSGTARHAGTASPARKSGTNGNTEETRTASRRAVQPGSVTSSAKTAANKAAAPAETAPLRGNVPAGERQTGAENVSPAPKKPIKRTARRNAGAPSGAKQEKAAPVRAAAVPASAGITAAEPAGKPAKQQIEVEMLKPADLIISRGPIDRPLLIIIIIMLCFGAVMVFSASYAASLNEKGTSYYYIIRHIAYIGIGTGLAVLEMAVLKYRFELLKRFSWLIYLAGLGLLAFVLVNGYARGVAKRWIFIGSFSFQPSEFMKLALVLFLASFLSNHQKKLLDKRFWYSSWFGDFIPICIVAIPCGLIFLENHLSGTIITFLIGLIVIWAAGSRKFWFLIALLVGAAVFYIAINYIDYVALRWDEFVHPENYSVTDELWQTIQGKIAVGSGGWFGVGLGNSRQKHMFVSQPQNDFIFSIICEELGFIGALFVIALFIAFIIRGMTVALRAPDTFSCLTAIGITAQIGLQAVLNMMVVVGVIPNTGISLPFFSYGGSSILMLMIEMGILLSISRFSYQKE